MKRVIIKFSDGGYANLDADAIVNDGEYVQIWKGQTELIGIVKLSEINAIYVSEKAN